MRSFIFQLVSNGKRVASLTSKIHIMGTCVFEVSHFLQEKRTPLKAGGAEPRTIA